VIPVELDSALRTVAIESDAYVEEANGGDAGATHVNKYGCFVIETEDWIDGINNPEWQV
jgi:aldose 1-epimerase